MDFRAFCSFDLDTDPMTFIYETYPVSPWRCTWWPKWIFYASDFHSYTTYSCDCAYDHTTHPVNHRKKIHPYYVREQLTVTLTLLTLLPHEPYGFFLRLTVLTSYDHRAQLRYTVNNALQNGAANLRWYSPLARQSATATCLQHKTTHLSADKSVILPSPVSLSANHQQTHNNQCQASRIIRLQLERARK